MDALENQLIDKAKQIYGEILPCGLKTRLADCFTYEKELGKLVFWFNVASDNSTRALIMKINGADQ